MFSGLPKGWNIKPVKHIFSVLNGATPASGEPSYWDGDIYWATPEDIGSLNGKILKDTRRKITEAGYQNSGTQLAPAGSIVMTTRAPVGNLAITEVPLCTNQGCRTLVPKLNGINSHYFYYQFAARKDVLGIEATGTTFLELGSDDLKSFPLWYPPISEQRAIADYLDRETARLDSLIAAKERLLELLAEKHRAVITHAVTRGLNPNVSLRDSGVEWLGEIPSHWVITPLRYAVLEKQDSIKTGPFGSQLLSSEMEEGEIKVYNQRSVIDKDFKSGENYISTEKYKQLESFTTFPGDLLVTTRGTIGRCAILPENAEKGILHPCLLRIQVNHRKLFSEFLVLAIQDSFLLETQLVLLSNATTIDVIYSETMKRFTIPLPPLSEQIKIVEYVKKQEAKINNLAQSTQRTIDLLHERRASLIAAVVSGQVSIPQT